MTKSDKAREMPWNNEQNAARCLHDGDDHNNQINVQEGARAAARGHATIPTAREATTAMTQLNLETTTMRSINTSKARRCGVIFANATSAFCTGDCAAEIDSKINIEQPSAAFSHAGSTAISTTNASKQFDSSCCGESR